VRTFDQAMNWAPYPAPDGRHYVFVRVVEDNNWEVFLGDLAGGEPKRLTFNPGFDGLPSLSKGGKKMLFARSATGRANLSTFVMDVSSLNPRARANLRGVPALTRGRPGRGARPGRASHAVVYLNPDPPAGASTVSPWMAAESALLSRHRVKQ
jgi:hypothetical protein